ncbi:MAG TPA: 16S rRNA (cytosine(1402)-N(4))-methyltransferase RsmH [Gemmatimonadales bacterium]|jgi:16S rRNA (cytosine1402-N4)-methyltransferase|nr:16S rRNA (cytosine(1402)-N(4))-methyltransferase RsmH [Gemmatimonadales bacterium]
MPDLDSAFHTPVLLHAVRAAAAGAQRAVDATLGDGGHAAALLGAGLEVLGIDRDPEAIAVSRRRLGDARIHYLEAPYASPEALSAVAGFEPDFILLDLGVSSRQLDEAGRGFTFRPGAPLDMRMGKVGKSAADLLNRAEAAALGTIFRNYGDEPRARRLAAEIVRRRERQAFTTSDDLVNAIRATLGPKSGPGDFARLFQAVRIAVNDELEGLGQALPAFRDVLRPGGRLSVITYHSGEDRLVKHSFREWSRSCICPPELPVCTCRGHPLGRVEPRKPVVPEDLEIAANPRARSAKLRSFVVSDAS